MSTFSVSLHTTADTKLWIERVAAHDSIKEDYYRLRFDDLTVYLSDEQCEALFYVLNNRERNNA